MWKSLHQLSNNEAKTDCIARLKSGHRKQIISSVCDDHKNEKDQTKSFLSVFRVISMMEVVTGQQNMH